MLNPVATGITHRGCKRENNEDAIAWQTCPTTGRTLAIVADGMGGYEGGEVASRLAIDVMTDRLADILDQERLERQPIKEALEAAVTEANSRIQAARGTNPAWARMGTTVVAAIVSAGVAHLIHIGDSRCYLHSRGQLSLKTRDDTVVQAMLDVGEITEAEVSRVPFRNVLTKALGVEPSVTSTYLELPLAPGDTLILCSDGVTGALPAAQWLPLLTEGNPPETQAQAFLETCLENQADDNVSLVLIHIPN